MAQISRRAGFLLADSDTSGRPVQCTISRQRGTASPETAAAWRVRSFLIGLGIDHFPLKQLVAGLR
jgi:hypothetical protein